MAMATRAVYDRAMKPTLSLPLVLVAAVGCNNTTSPPMPVSPTSCPSSTAPAGANDADHDQLDDAMELAWAQQYLPYLSISPQDDCFTGGIVARVEPLPMGFVRIRYDVLYDTDCGIGGHIGDDERFAMIIDPRVAPPQGIVRIKAIAHKGSECNKESECGQCAGQSACQTLVENGTPWPAVWVSRDKHGNYVDRSSTCKLGNTCLDDCDDNATRAALPVVNVGEPCYPLVHDLTTEGFITAENGWANQALYHYAPWGGQPFGQGGVIADDLTSPDFEIAACP
jgi:hypothetical protein